MSTHSPTTESRLPPGALWWMGGASLIVIAIFHFLGPQNLQLAQWNGLLLAAFSFPHFVLSYIWFFGQKELRSQHRWMTFVLPVMLALTSYCIIQSDDETVSFIMIAGLLVLYWHFAKQAFGCAIWLSSPSAHWRSGWRRKLLLTTCLGIASYGFIRSQTIAGHSQIFRFYVTPLQVEPLIAWIFGGLSIFCSLILLGALITQSSAQSLPQKLYPLVPIAALYAWLEPRFFIGGLSLAPIFHGMQFIPFPSTLLSRRWSYSPWTQKMGQRGLWFALMMVSVVVGWLIFEGAPRGLMINWPQKSTNAVAALIWSLNLMHFIIDSVSWRRNSKVASDAL